MRRRALRLSGKYLFLAIGLAGCSTGKEMVTGDVFLAFAAIEGSVRGPDGPVPNVRVTWQAHVLGCGTLEAAAENLLDETDGEGRFASTIELPLFSHERLCVTLRATAPEAFALRSLEVVLEDVPFVIEAQPSDTASIDLVLVPLG
jgi:hypothetical protein